MSSSNCYLVAYDSVALDNKTPFTYAIGGATLRKGRASYFLKRPMMARMVSTTAGSDEAQSVQILYTDNNNNSSNGNLDFAWWLEAVGLGRVYGVCCIT